MSGDHLKRLVHSILEITDQLRFVEFRVQVLELVSVCVLFPAFATSARTAVGTRIKS